MTYRDTKGKYARKSGFRVLMIGVILGGIFVAGGAYVAYDKGLLSSVVEVERIAVEEVAPEWAEDEEAVEAAQAVIRRKELKADESHIIEARTALRAEFDAADAILADQLELVQKELGTF